MGKRIISTGAKDSTFSVGSDTNNYYQSTKQINEAGANQVKTEKPEPVKMPKDDAPKATSPSPKVAGFNIITNQPKDEKAERCGKGFFALKQKEIHDSKKYNIITNADTSAQN